MQAGPRMATNMLRNLAGQLRANGGCSNQTFVWSSRRITKGCTRSTQSGGCEVVGCSFVPGEPRRSLATARYCVRPHHVILLVTLASTSCTDGTSQLQQDAERRAQAQEEAVDAILLSHYKPLQDGLSAKEIGRHIKHHGLDYMVGKPQSEFPELFAAAFKPREILKRYPEWEPRHQIRDWMEDKESVVLLDANIWKHIGTLENAGGTRPDTLVIALDGGTITDYKFFANMAY